MSEDNSNLPIAIPNIGDEEITAVIAVMKSGWLTQGPRVKEFEDAFAARHLATDGIATTSCTTALHLTLAAMGVGPGDEVIVPAFTWVASANVVTHLGAKPVFVDVCADTYNLNPALVSDLVSEKTRAVMAVHLFGLCVDIDSVRDSIPDRVSIIEDAACAAGAKYKSRSAGSLGLAGSFSFHPRKSITTGEGGMVVTNDSALAETMRCLRNHGASVSEEARHRGPRPYEMAAFDVPGFNVRMTDLQAAVGFEQLKKLDRFIEERAQLASRYVELLGRVSWLTAPKVPAGYEHGWQAFVCLIDSESAPMPRDNVLARLQEVGIAGRAGTHAVTRLGAYREKITQDYPIANKLADWTIALPLYNGMTERDVTRVVSALENLS